MYHVVEFQGVRKTVKASPRATCTDVASLAFGFDPWGDTRTSQITVIGSTKSKDVAAGMMCNVWPVARACACEPKPTREHAESDAIDMGRKAPCLS